MIHCGHVYHLYFAVAEKEKLIVPAFALPDGRIRAFTINSLRTAFQASRPEVCRHILPISVADNPAFLTHDSWLSCHEIIGGWTVPEIEANEDCYRGPLDAATLVAVRALMPDSRLHSALDKEAILAQWP